MTNMLNDFQTYLVGGAVRDALLDLPVKDRDWVVVGATETEMEQAGFERVGKDFPVFLDPKTKEEYALARTERKNGEGYRGFEVSTSQQVTLSEDLSRRDLTINAMALPASWVGESGPRSGFENHLIDPFGGRQDVDKNIFRHTSEAFQEDPVRILRVARLMARMPHFSVAEETMKLMKKMVAQGEVGALVQERVWKEWSRGLMETEPRLMIDTLKRCGALNVLVPELGHAIDDNEYERRMFVLRGAARNNASLAVRMGCLELKAFETSFRLPSEVSDVCAAVRDVHEDASTPETVMKTLERLDVFRRCERFDAWIQVKLLINPERDWEFWKAISQKAIGINASMRLEDGKTLVEDCKDRGIVGQQFGLAIRQLRLKEIKKFLDERKTLMPDIKNENAMRIRIK